MIIIKLMGGLGNQLFQYAFGRSISLDLNHELFFELSHFDTDYAKSKKHDFYSLSLFNINENIGTVQSNDFEKKYSKIKHYNEDSFNEITGFPSLRNINKIQFPAYFNGHWQSEKYFFHNEKIIRKELQFKYPFKGKNKEIAKDIIDNNSVAMHIRRGDYKNISHYGLCEKDYYKKSVTLIEEQIKNPKFYIFSDDPQWVKENIQLSYPSYNVTHNGVENGYEDLHLMSLCKHFIIANSSFSWWGAWLSNNTEKIITTPKPWFISRQPNVNYIDKGKNFFQISNDRSDVFNKSKRILFKLNPFKYILDSSLSKKLELNVDQGMLNIHTLGTDSKLFLKEIQKFNDNNKVIMKISIKPKSDDVFKIYYTTKKSTNTNNNSIYSHYYKNEDVDIYFPLKEEIILNNLIIVPATSAGSEIMIKSLEIREIH